MSTGVSLQPQIGKVQPEHKETDETLLRKAARFLNSPPVQGSPSETHLLTLWECNAASIKIQFAANAACSANSGTPTRPCEYSQLTLSSAKLLPPASEAQICDSVCDFPGFPHPSDRFSSRHSHRWEQAAFVPAGVLMSRNSATDRPVPFQIARKNNSLSGSCVQVSSGMESRRSTNREQYTP